MPSFFNFKIIPDHQFREQYTIEDPCNNQKKIEDTEVSTEEEAEDKVPSVKEIIPYADMATHCTEQCIPERTNLLKSTETEDQTLMEETKETTERMKTQVKQYNLNVRVSKKKVPKANTRKAKRKRARREYPLESTIIYVSPRGPRHSERVMERMEMF